MRVNPKSLMKVAGFQAFHVQQMEMDMDAEPNEDNQMVLPAWAAFVTPENIEAARQHDQENPQEALSHENMPDIDTGSLLVSRRMTDGLVSNEVIPPGSSAGLSIPDPRTPDPAGRPDDGSYRGIPFTGPSMMAARTLLDSDNLPDIELAEEVRNQREKVLEGIDCIRDVILQDTNPERFPAHVARDVYFSAIANYAGDIDLGVSDEEFIRKMTADRMRAQIGRLNPDHPDALGNGAADLSQMINAARETGADINAAITANGAQVHHGTQAASMPSSNQMRNMIAQNDRLCREVFGAMTRTDIGDLQVALMNDAGFDGLINHFRANGVVHEGEWINEAHNRVSDIARDRMPNYSCEMAMGTIDDLDVLVVRDNVSRDGHSYAYAWPSEDRLPVMEIGRGHVATISPDEIPSQEEVDRLSREVEAATMMHDGDVPGDGIYDLEDPRP